MPVQGDGWMGESITVRRTPVCILPLLGAIDIGWIAVHLACYSRSTLNASLLSLCIVNTNKISRGMEQSRYYIFIRHFYAFVLGTAGFTDLAMPDGECV